MTYKESLTQLYNKYGEIPNVFSLYNLQSLSNEIANTITASNGSCFGRAGAMLLKDSYSNGKDNVKKYKENKMNYNLVNFCEFDKYAVKSYCAVHGVDEGLNLGDITKVDVDSLPTDVDFISHGSPCFTAETLVLTDKGYKPIIDVEIGDMVLDHTNQYSKVTNRFAQGEKEIWEVNAMGSDIIRTTSNHKFYVRGMKKVWHNNIHKAIREFSSPSWVECKDLSKDYYLGIAINQNSIVPKWKGCSDGRRGVTESINTLDMNNKQLWYMVGRFLGDGWTRRKGERSNNLSGVIICCGKHKADKFEKELEGFLNYAKIEEGTVYKYQFCNKELATFCEQFGHGASSKFIPSFVFDMPTELIRELLRGYFDSNGSVDNNGKIKITMVSKLLAYGIGQLVAKVYHRHYSIYFSEGLATHIIEDKVVNQHNTYTLSFNPQENKQDHAFYEDGYLWVPINSITNTHNFEQVYDIEVENTHSFTANGVIAHNCQSFSISGKQEGGVKGSGTRSSLLWNSVEIIKHCKPKFVIWENVKNVLSKRHKPVFEEYIHEMKNNGYNTYYKVLNAKDYGIPQNRQRIYAISIREDIDKNKEYDANNIDNMYYTNLYPEPFDNGLRLKDFLEDKVDEKYYLKKTLQFFIKNSFTQEARGNTYRFEPHIKDNANIARMVTTQAGCRMDDNFVADIDSSDDKIRSNSTNKLQLEGMLDMKSNDHNRRVYSQEGIAPTLLTMQGGNTQPKVTELADKFAEQYRVRKLTPKECWRLMGFGDEDFEKAQNAGISNAQLYKQAGNSIVVNVLEEIYKCLRQEYPNDFTSGMNVISLFSGIGAFEKALERVDFSEGGK